MKRLSTRGFMSISSSISRIALRMSRHDSEAHSRFGAFMVMVVVVIVDIEVWRVPSEIGLHCRLGIPGSAHGESGGRRLAGLQSKTLRDVQRKQRRDSLSAPSTALRSMLGLANTPFLFFVFCDLAHASKHVFMTSLL
jgi:hypothetical protein